MKWEKIVVNNATINCMALISKIYKQLIHLNNKKQPNRKMGRRPKQIFLQRQHMDNQQAPEKCPTSAIIREKQKKKKKNKKQKKHKQKIKIKKKKKKKKNPQTINAGEGVKKTHLLHPPPLSVGMQIGTTTVELSMEGPQKIRNTTTL